MNRASWSDISLLRLLCKVCNNAFNHLLQQKRKKNELNIRLLILNKFFLCWKIITNFTLKKLWLVFFYLLSHVFVICLNNTSSSGHLSSCFLYHIIAERCAIDGKRLIRRRARNISRSGYCMMGKTNGVCNQWEWWGKGLPQPMFNLFHTFLREACVETIVDS